MGQSVSSDNKGQVLEQQYQSSLTMFSTFEQGELKAIFEKICQSKGTSELQLLKPEIEGFQRSQLQVIIMMSY